MPKNRKDEASRRDAAMARASANPDNNHDQILLAARHWLLHQRIGAMVVSGQVFHAVMEANPNLEPAERRVMGPVMRALARERIIVKAGISTRERTHNGMATEWKRLAA